MGTTRTAIRRRATWTALLGAFACAFSAVPAAGQDSAGTEVAVDPNLFSIPETLLVRALYERARGHLEARRWAEAIADLQAILEEHRGDILPGEKPRTKSGRMSEGMVHAGAAVRASALLSSLPADARKLYRDRYEVEASRALDTARAGRDARALGEVGRRWPLCDAAEHAFVSLGDLELEVGHENEARFAWERALRLRLEDPALTLATADDWKAARARVAAQTDAGDASGVLRRIDFALTHADAALAASRTGEGQRSLRLPAAREASGPPPGENGDAWAQPYDLPYHPWVNDPFRDALFPVRGGDTLFVSTSLRLLALHAYTGDLLWDSGEPEGWSRLSSGARTDLFKGIDPDAALVAPAVSGSVVVAALQLPFALLHTDTFQNIQITVPIPERRLFAFDVTTGKKLWDHTPPPGWDGDGGSFSDRMSIAGPPVIAGSRILVPCVRMQGRIYYNVGCFDLDTGALLWSSDVISGQRELNMFGRAEHEFCAAPLRVEGDRVVAVTQLGTVACLDLFSGDILWETLHETIPMPRTRQFYAPRLPAVWRNTPPVVESGVVLATPTNSPDLIALDLKTGSLLWSTSSNLLQGLVGRSGMTPANPSNILLGAAPDAIYLGLGGDKIVALDAPAGLSEPGRVHSKWVWREDETGRVRLGRPVVCADRIVVPGLSERIDLDRMTGAKLRSVPWNGGGNLLVGSGELFSVTNREVQGYFEWDVLVGRARAELARAPQDPPRVLALARLLDGRGSAEWQRGASEAARARFAEARSVIEQALSGPASDDVRAVLRPEYHSVLRGEARVRAGLADSNGALADLRTARAYAPDAQSLRDTLLEELAILRERAETAGADPAGTKAALDELMTSCADLTLVAERKAGVGAFRARFIPVTGRIADESAFTLEMPVGLWVTLEHAALHERSHEIAAEFADLHAILQRWHDIELGDGTAGELAGERVGALIAAGSKDGYETYEKQAQDLFDAGVRMRDGSALAQVPRLYPYSRAARAANDARLDIALAQGDVATVARIVASELPVGWSMDTATERETRLVLRLAGVLENAQNLEASGGLQRALAESHGDLVLDASSGATLRQAAEKAPVFTAFTRAPPVGTFRRDATNVLDRPWAGEYELLGSPLPSVPVQELAAGRPQELIFALNQSSLRQTITVLDLTSDEVAAARWTFDLPADARPPSTGSGYWNRRSAFAAGRLMMATTSGVVAIDTANGTRAWQWQPTDTVADSISIACSSGVAVVVVTPRGDRDRWFVVALDAHSGAELWRDAQMEGGVQRMPIVSGRHVVFVPTAQRKQVVVRDLFTGARSRRFELDTPVSTAVDQDAWIEGDLLIVPWFNEVRAPERNHVLAYDLRTGVRAWRVPLDESAGKPAGPQEGPVRRWLQGIIQQNGRTWLLLQTTDAGQTEKALFAFDTRIGALTPLSTIRLGGDDLFMGLTRPARVELQQSGPLLVLSPRAKRGTPRDALLRCIDLDRGELWSQALGFGFDELYPGVLPMPGLSDTTVAVAYAVTSKSPPGIGVSIAFFDVGTGAMGGRRDLLRMEKDVPLLVPLGDTLLVKTRSTLEILK